MGLTANSTGLGAVDCGFEVQRESENDRVVAFAGNPNVGKSTAFNALTGMNQHTGNWPGKTVASAQGRHHRMGRDYVIVDLPGTYSLLAHSAEEEVARDFICFGGADAVVVVCDATCLERNLNLVLQTLEITPNVVVCVNLCDEAEKKHIRLDLHELERRLGVPVVGTSARSERGLDELMQAVCAVIDGTYQASPSPIRYQDAIEEAAAVMEPVVGPLTQDMVDRRWLSLRLLDPDESLAKALQEHLKMDLTAREDVREAAERAWEILQAAGIEREELRDRIVAGIVLRAEEICREAVFCEDNRANRRDRRLDRILTSRLTGIPIMLALLCGIFWLTMTGANYPSALLSSGLFWIQDRLTDLFHFMGAPEWLHGMLVLGMYRVLAWVGADFRGFVRKTSSIS